MVVGGTLASHLFSYLHGVPIIVPSLESYFPYEKIGDNKKENIINSLSFVLSLRGLKPFADLNTEMFWEGSNVLRLIINNRSTQYLHFNKLHVFEPHCIRRMDYNCEKNVCLVDEFKKVFCESHKHSKIITPEENFLKEIHFVGASKVYGLSEIREEDIAKEYYSEYLSKFKLRHTLEENGIGSGVKHRRVRFDHIRRHQRYKYLSGTSPCESVELMLEKEEELWKQVESSIRLELSQLKRGNPYLDMLGMIV